VKRRSFVRAGVACAVASLAPSAFSAPRVVRFGQSASLSGGQAAYGRDVRDGILAAFAAANEREATTGVHFELTTLDDGGVRSRCLQNALTLTDSGTLALLGLTSGAGAEACLPVVEDARMAMLGTASGNMGIRARHAAQAFHVRAGYDAEYRRMVSYAKDFGLRRVGVVYLGDTSQANLEAMKDALGSLGVQPQLSVPIDRNSGSFEAVATQLSGARLDCVLFTANATPVARIIDHLHRAKFAGLFYASSFAGQDLVDLLTTRQQSCVMSMVVPRPRAIGVQLVSQCQRDIALVPGHPRMGITTLEGYVAGRVAVEAATTALRSGGIDRARLREALTALRIDLGGYQVDFAGGTQGSRYVDLVAVDRYGRLAG
jgi:ABC-type branched-subunit amino acid transport system substrate-binding protein